jgi:hypothetical protein
VHQRCEPAGGTRGLLCKNLGGAALLTRAAPAGVSDVDVDDTAEPHSSVQGPDAYRRGGAAARQKRLCNCEGFASRPAG